jgi:hypothetical protein
VLCKTFDKGLTKRLDYEDVQADLDKARQTAVDQLMSRLLRAEIYRASRILEAAASATSTNWLAPTPVINTNPDADLLRCILDSITAAGLPVTRAVFGAGAWLRRQTNLLERLTPGGIANSGFSEEQLANFLGLDRVHRARCVRTDTDTTKEFLVGNNKVYLFNAQDGQSREDPSNIKRFVTPKEGGRWCVYEQRVNAYTWDITVSHYSNSYSRTNLEIFIMNSEKEFID